MIDWRWIKMTREERQARCERTLDRIVRSVGWVYVIRNAEVEDGRYKIGFSAQGVPDRLAGLQVGSPYRLAISEAWAVADAYDLEQSLHEHVAPYRRHGEWFLLGEAELRLVRAFAWAHAERKHGDERRAREAVAQLVAEGVASERESS